MTAVQGGRSAEQEAYAFLLEEIRSGRLAGGTHVAADRISTELGISRIPVREAMRRLASEGFLTIRSNRGAFVERLSAEKILELYEMRAVLEGMAIRYAALAFDERGMAEGHAALEQLDRARAEPEWFVSAHNRFHDVVNAYCPRPRMIGEIVRLRTAAEPYLRLTLQHSPTAQSATVEEHRSILEGLSRRDPDECERIMRAHVLGTDILSLLPDILREGAARGG